MKRNMILALTAIWAAAAWAGLGSLISSFAVPDINAVSADAHGIASDGTYMWVHALYYGRGPILWKFVPSTGGVLASYQSPIVSASSRTGYGMDYRLIDGQPRLEIAAVAPEYSGSFIFRLTTTASIVSSTRVPAAGTRIRGVCWDGSNNWVTVPDSGGTLTDVYRLDNNSSVLSSFRLGGPGCANGIDRQGSYFWFSVDYVNGGNSFHGVYKTNTLGSVIASFDDFGRLGQGIDDCWYETNRIWVSDGKYVLCYDARICAPGIVPASLGRVKAIYR